MNNEEAIRLECLKLALAEHVDTETNAVKRAAAYADFILNGELPGDA